MKCKLCNERESICKGLCGNCYTRKWKREHPENMKLMNKRSYQKNKHKRKEYNIKNKERITELKSNWYQKNKEDLKKYWAKYRKDNPEFIKKLNKEYIKNNPEKMKANHDRINFDGLRIKALERDNFTCQKCWMTEEEHLKKWGCSLIVHHKDGNGRDKKNPNNTLKNLQTLCKKCHGEAHGRPIKKNYSFE